MYSIRLDGWDGKAHYEHTMDLDLARYFRDFEGGTIVGWPYP